MQDIKVSIITRCYNRLEYTTQCIASAARFIQIPFEHIVVNNGSTDGTREWLDYITNNIPYYRHLRVFHLDKNLGDMGGMKFGVEKAKTDYIIQMDNDCVLKYYNSVKVLMEVLEKLNADAVMLKRTGVKTILTPTSDIQEITINCTPKQVTVHKVSFPTMFYLIKKNTFESISNRLYRCSDYRCLPNIYKITNITAHQIEGYDSISGSYLQHEKYP